MSTELNSREGALEYALIMTFQENKAIRYAEDLLQEEKSKMKKSQKGWPQSGEMETYDITLPADIVKECYGNKVNPNALNEDGSYSVRVGNK